MSGATKNGGGNQDDDDEQLRRLRAHVFDCVRSILKKDGSPYKDFDIEGFESHCEVKAIPDPDSNEGRYTHYVKFRLDRFRRATTLRGFQGKSPEALIGRSVQVLDYMWNGERHDYNGVIHKIRDVSELGHQGRGIQYCVKFDDGGLSSWLEPKTTSEDEKGKSRIVLRNVGDEMQFMIILRKELVDRIKSDGRRFLDPFGHISRNPATSAALPPAKLLDDGYLNLRLLPDSKWNVIAYEVQLRARRMIAAKLVESMRALYNECRAALPGSTPIDPAPLEATDEERAKDLEFARIVYKRAGLRDCDTHAPVYGDCRAGPFDGQLRRKDGGAVEGKTNRDRLCFSNLRADEKDRIKIESGGTQHRPYLIKNFVAMGKLFLGKLAGKHFDEKLSQFDFDNMMQLMQRIPWLRNKLLSTIAPGERWAFCESIRKRRCDTMHLKCLSREEAKNVVALLSKVASAVGVDAKDVGRIDRSMRLELVDPNDVGESELRKFGYGGLLDEQRRLFENATMHRERMTGDVQESISHLAEKADGHAWLGRKDRELILRNQDEFKNRLTKIEESLPGTQSSHSAHCNTILTLSMRRGDSIEPLHRGTRSKLLADLCAWAVEGKQVEGNQRCIFWMQGSHGVGKSALFKAVMEGVAKTRVDVAAFYAKAKDPRLSNICNAIFCWAAALRLQVAADDIRLGDSKWQSSEAHESLLRTFVFDPLIERNRSTLLMLDALDECAEGRAGFVETVAKLVVEYREKKGMDVRFLVSSVTKPSRDSMFRKKKLCGIMQLGSKKDPSLDADIEAFSRDCVEDAVDGRFETGNLSDIGRSIRERSRRCFLYARFAVGLVREEIKAGNVRSKESLLELVKAFPPGLSALFFDYMTRPFEAERGNVRKDVVLRNDTRVRLLSTFLAVGEVCPMWLLHLALDANMTLRSESQQERNAAKANADMQAAIESMESLAKRSKNVLCFDGVLYEWLLLGYERYVFTERVRKTLMNTSSSTKSSDDDAYSGWTDDECSDEETDAGFTIPVSCKDRPRAKELQYLREHPSDAGNEIVQKIVESATRNVATYIRCAEFALAESRGSSMLGLASIVEMTRRIEQVPEAIVRKLLRRVQKEWDKKCQVCVGEAAQICFDAIVRSGGEPSVTEYSIVLSCWCNAKRMEKAREVFDSMLKAKVKPNEVTFTTLIDGFCKMKQMKEAREVFDSMLKAKVIPDEVTFTTLIDGFCKMKQMKEATRILQQMRANGIFPDAVTYGTLIDAWSRLKRRPDKAEEVLEMLLSDPRARADTRCFNAAMLGYAYSRNKKKVLTLYKRLRASGCPPDKYTIKSLDIAGLRTVRDQAEAEMRSNVQSSHHASARRSRNSKHRRRPHHASSQSHQTAASSSRDHTSAAQSSSTWLRGVVKKYDASRQYGFILSADGGQDVHFKASHLIFKSDSATRNVRMGTRVHFQSIVTADDRRRATSVRVFTATTRGEGTVEFFNSKTGRGRIIPFDGSGAAVMFHARVVDASGGGARALRKGTLVQFQEAPDDGSGERRASRLRVKPPAQA